MLRCLDRQKESIVRTSRFWDCDHGFSSEGLLQEQQNDGPGCQVEKLRGMYPGWTFYGREGD